MRSREMLMQWWKLEKVANKIDNTRERAVNYCHEVKKYFEPIRYNVDKLELLVDDEDWPLVKYRELLFLK